MTTETKVEAVAWQYRLKFAEDCAWRTAFGSINADYNREQYEIRALVPASAITALEGEVAEQSAWADKWKALHDAVSLAHEVQAKALARALGRAEVSERRVAELEAALRESEGTTNSHRCRMCFWPYTPARNESEDCPKCGYDGASPLTKETP